MVEIGAMGEDYIHIDCLHGGPVDPSLAPRRGGEWQDAPDLPPHPWSDETISDLAKQYRSITEGWRGDPARELMRAMIQRYGSCALLAWEEGLVVGQLRFYPLTIARLIGRAAPTKQPPASCAMEFEADPEALWVQCVMTCRPYTGLTRDVPPTSGGDRIHRAAEEAGGRRGVGLKLAKALIPWAREHGWKRIVKRAHADLDCMYGQCGGGGKTFWEKAGFHVISTSDWTYPHDDEWKAIVESQAKANGMSTREAWTWFHMAHEL